MKDDSQIAYLNQPFKDIFPSVIRKGGWKFPFIVRGRNSYDKSLAKQVIIKEVEQYTEFLDFSTNPKFEDGIKGKAKFLQNEHDVIIAVGGGSVIDMAKIIAAFSEVRDKEEELITQQKKIDKISIPIIAIPTTFGTGSEATHFAVVYYKGQKYSLAHTDLLPHIAIVSSELGMTMPKNIRRAASMDALCQSIESYWAVKATAESRAYAEKGLRILFGKMRAFINSPNEENMADVAEAAYWGGKAINISKTTGAHALSYYLTSQYGLLHGLAVGMFILPFMEYNYNAKQEEINGGEEAINPQSSILEIAKLAGQKDIGELIAYLEELFNKIGVQYNLRELLGENTPSLDTLLENVNLQRLQNNPRKLEKETFLDVFTKYCS